MNRYESFSVKFMIRRDCLCVIVVYFLQIKSVCGKESLIWLSKSKLEKGEPTLGLEVNKSKLSIQSVCGILKITKNLSMGVLCVSRITAMSVKLTLL